MKLTLLALLAISLTAQTRPPTQLPAAAIKGLPVVNLPTGPGGLCNDTAGGFILSLMVNGGCPGAPLLIPPAIPPIPPLAVTSVLVELPNGTVVLAKPGNIAMHVDPDPAATGKYLLNVDLPAPPAVVVPPVPKTSTLIVGTDMQILNPSASGAPLVVYVARNGQVLTPGLDYALDPATNGYTLRILPAALALVPITPDTLLTAAILYF